MGGLFYCRRSFNYKVFIIYLDLRFRGEKVKGFKWKSIELKYRKVFLRFYNKEVLDKVL